VVGVVIGIYGVLDNYTMFRVTRRFGMCPGQR
jgi:hypothetical protein